MTDVERRLVNFYIIDFIIISAELFSNFVSELPFYVRSAVSVLAKRFLFSSTRGNVAVCFGLFFFQLQQTFSHSPKMSPFPPPQMDD